jgi:hypothetical protein
MSRGRCPCFRRWPSRVRARNPPSKLAPELISHAGHGEVSGSWDPRALARYCRPARARRVRSISCFACAEPILSGMSAHTNMCGCVSGDNNRPSMTSRRQALPGLRASDELAARGSELLGGGHEPWRHRYTVMLDAGELSPSALSDHRTLPAETVLRQRPGRLTTQRSLRRRARSSSLRTVVGPAPPRPRSDHGGEGRTA